MKRHAEKMLLHEERDSADLRTQRSRGFVTGVEKVPDFVR